MSNQIESHNSYLTNQEMARLSTEIDMVAMTAAQTLKFQAIQAYFNAAEHYYMKLHPLLENDEIVVIESVRKSYYSLEVKIEGSAGYQNRKAIKLLLQITKDFYFKVRSSLQNSGKYYFRVHKRRDKGLDFVPYYEEGENENDE